MKTVDILKDRREAFKKAIARKEQDLINDKKKFKALCIDVFKTETGIIEGTKIEVQTSRGSYRGKVEGFSVKLSGDVVIEGWLLNKNGEVGKRPFKTELDDTYKILDKPQVIEKIKWKL